MELQYKEKVLSLLTLQRKQKKELYDHLGMTANGFNAMLDNNTVSALKLAATAEFLGVDVTYFYGLPERKTPPAPIEVDSYLREALNRLEASLARQVEVKDSQIAVKDNQIAGLQRMVDFLMQGQPKSQTSFLEPVTMTEGAPIRKLNSKMQAAKTA